VGIVNPLTLEEVKERLKTLDEISLLELLRLTSEEIVEAFSYEIETDLERLEKEVNEYE
jgi:hypothetical protein